MEKVEKQLKESASAAAIARERTKEGPLRPLYSYLTKGSSQNKHSLEAGNSSAKAGQLVAQRNMSQENDAACAAAEASRELEDNVAFQVLRHQEAVLAAYNASLHAYKMAGSKGPRPRMLDAELSLCAKAPTLADYLEFPPGRVALQAVREMGWDVSDAVLREEVLLVLEFRIPSLRPASLCSCSPHRRVQESAFRLDPNWSKGANELEPTCPVWYRNAATSKL